MIFPLILLFIITPSYAIQSFATLKTDFDIYGSRLASNDDVVVLARNDHARFILIYAPFGPEYYCEQAPITSSDFVTNIAIIQTDYRTKTEIVYLTIYDNGTEYLQLKIFIINKTECFDSVSLYLAENYLLYDFGEEFEYASVFKTDPIDRYVYGFFSGFAYIYDIEKNDLKKFSWDILLPNISFFFPKDADITITKDNIRIAIVVGYFNIDFDSTLPTVYLLRLEPPSTMFLLDNLTLINDIIVGGTFAYVYHFDYVMSVSIENYTQQVLIGLPFFGKTFLLQFNSTNIILVKNYTQSARSVTWINNGTQGVLLLNDIETLPWASSQVQIIDTSLNDTEHATIYAIPNNQQIITFNTPRNSMRFIRITASNNQPVILTDGGLILYAVNTPPGYFTELTEISSYVNTPKLCPAGTFKNNFGSGPCIVCPTGYKNPMINMPYIMKNLSLFSNIECKQCSSNSFCPLASINEVNLSLYPSMDQAYTYPNSPANTNYDDIVMTNTFQINMKNNHCLIVSPMFWTLLVLGIAGLILILMSILYCIPTRRHHFKYLTHIFRHTDLIGDGELWIGGLFSFAILVLSIFGFWFGSVYFKQYPIETTQTSYFACDTSLRNAKFTSSLQMVTTRRLEEEKIIFQLLDQQNWTLTIDLIQTAFQCQDIRVQSNVGSYKVKLQIDKCFLQSDNATRTIIVSLPNHFLDLQFNFTGNTYVAAIRICLNGPSKSHNESHSTVQELSFCQLLSFPDQTIAQTTDLKFDLTKIINRTEGLDINDPTIYNGIWIPSMIIKSLDDHIAYEQQGNYLRYLSSQQILMIELSETQFFVKNIQEPIARSAEIIFHSILFFTVCIELFGLAFLIFKLVILPLIKKLIHIIELRRFPKYSQHTVL